MRNPDLDTKAKLATTRKHAKRVVKEAKVRWVQTKLKNIENYKDQPRNHWRAAREFGAGKRRKSR